MNDIQIDLSEVVKLIEHALRVTDQIHFHHASGRSTDQALDEEVFDRLLSQLKTSTCQIGSQQVSAHELFRLLNILGNLHAYKRSVGWDGALDKLYEAAKPITKIGTALSSNGSLR